MSQKSLIFVMVFTMGFVIMSVELLGGKILAPYFGSSIHVWGSIITVFMLALSIGYALGGIYSKHAPDIRKFGYFSLLPLFFFGLLSSLPRRSVISCFSRSKMNVLGVGFLYADLFCAHYYHGIRFTLCS